MKMTKHCFKNKNALLYTQMKCEYIFEFTTGYIAPILHKSHKQQSKQIYHPNTQFANINLLRLENSYSEFTVEWFNVPFIFDLTDRHKTCQTL